MDLWGAMPSLDFETEKAAFRDYYSENQKLLLDAEVFFRSLVGSLLSGAASITPPALCGRVKDREEAIRKFIRNTRGAVGVADRPQPGTDVSGKLPSKPESADAAEPLAPARDGAL
jgi:hypothetical protein